MNKKTKMRAALALLFSLILVFSLSACGKKAQDMQETADAQPAAQTQEEVSSDTQETADASSNAQITYQVDAVEGINTLMNTYYTAYANGDTATLQTIATPMSDQEQQYISLISQLVDHYDNLKVYSKDGMEEGSYVISVSMDMYFVNISTPAPGIESFYIRTGDDGSFYIDNLYSWFNLSSQENATDESVLSFMEEYENSADMKVVFADVQTAYNTALNTDPALNTMMNTTLQDAVSQWQETGEVPDLSAVAAGTQDTSAQEQTDETAQTDEQTQDTQDAQTDETDTEDTTTTDYLPTGTTVTLSAATNARSSMSDSASATLLYPGTTVTVVMSYSEGWTQVSWDGGSGYIKTELLL